MAKLKEMKAQWEKVLETREEGGDFYRPDSDKFERLRPAAIDPVSAERVLAEEFALQDGEVLVMLRNPSVKGAKDRFRATLETYNQAWNLDEILRQYSAFTEDLMTGVGPAKGREPVEMKFPFPGVLALKGEIVSQEVKGSKKTLEIAVRTAITQFRKAYWNLLFSHRAREITTEMLGLLSHLEAVARTRYEAGRTSFQDLIKVSIEKEKVEEDLRSIGEQQRNIEAKILEILDLKPTAGAIVPKVVRPESNVPSLDLVYSLALQKRQELQRTRDEIGKMERMIEMVETAVYPLYSLNLSLFQDEAVSQVGTYRKKEPFEVTTTASTGAGLPKKPWYGSNDAYLGETRQKLAALREDLEGARAETLFRVREAWFRLDLANREEALYDKRVVNLSQAALEVSTRGYETGNVTFADVIGSYSNWLKDNLALERRRGDLGISRAELEEAVGSPWKD